MLQNMVPFPLRYGFGEFHFHSVGMDGHPIAPVEERPDSKPLVPDRRVRACHKLFFRGLVWTQHGQNAFVGKRQPSVVPYVKMVRPSNSISMTDAFASSAFWIISYSSRPE